MERDVYTKLISKLKDVKDIITAIPTVTAYADTVPASGPCSVSIGDVSTIRGWQFLVETSTGVWSDVNQFTYFYDGAIFLYLEGDNASYRSKDYKLFVYTLPAEETEG